MTKREGAIVSAFTGYLIGNLYDMYKYAEEVMGRPILTHELANIDFANELREKSRKDFERIRVE